MHVPTYRAPASYLLIHSQALPELQCSDGDAPSYDVLLLHSGAKRMSANSDAYLRGGLYILYNILTIDQQHGWGWTTRQISDR